MINHEKIDLAKEIKELQANDPGKFRGDGFKYLVNYIKKKEGEEGWRKVVEKLAKLGYKIPDPRRVNDMVWLPSSLGSILMVTFVKVFKWQEEDLIDLGRNYVHFSRMLKFFMRYFSSPKKTLEAGARKWRQYYTFGRLETVSYDPKKKFIILRLVDYRRHPFICLYFKGVYGRVVEIATGSRRAKVEETKCEFRGDPYHEFVITW